MLKFFCAITGDDYQMLVNDTPESRKKVSGLASCIFVPVIIWYAIGFLLATQILNLGLLNGLIVATVLAFLIFLIERNIIMAEGKKAIKWFRIILGIFIALLGAVFLDEIIFHDDIEIQLELMGAEKTAALVNELDMEYKPLVEAALLETAQKQHEWQSALAEAMREADGTGGSGRKGVDAITRIKLDAAETLRLEYEKARADQESLLQRIEKQKGEIRSEANHFAEAGLLTRVKALFTMVFSDWAMGIIYFLLTGFLFSMEFLVVIMKNNWRKTNYEYKLELIEEIGRKRMEKIRNHDAGHFDAAMLEEQFISSRNKLQNTRGMSIFS